MMLHLEADDCQLGEQLMAVARDPTLRRSVYDRLGEYCHQCRNRLNSLKLSLYLGRRGTTDLQAVRWDALERHYLELERLVERVQVICRPMTLNRVTIGLELLIDDRAGEWSRLLRGRGGDLECVRPAERMAVSLDVNRIASALDALAAWRAEDAPERTTARVRWWAELGMTHLAWEEARQSLGNAPSHVRAEDATWALPNLARVVAAHDGDLCVEDHDGWRLELSWPSVPR